MKPDSLTAGGSKADPSPPSFREKILHATFWSAACLWGNRVLTLVFFAILARLLGPKAFGLVALSSVYIGFLMVFQEQGFGHAIIQRDQLHPDHLNAAFWMNVTLSLALALVTVLGAPVVGWLFHEPRLAGIVRALSLLLIIGALTSVQRAWCYRNFHFRSLAIATVVGGFTGGVIGTVAALNGCDVWSLVLYQVTARACESAVIWWQSDWRPRLRFRREQFWDMFSFGKYVLGGQLASAACFYAPDMIIGFVLGPTAVGLYNVACRCIRMLLEVISKVLERVSLPTFARLQQRPEYGRAVLLKATGQIAFLAFPVFAAMAVLAPEIVSMVFGEQWMKAAPAMCALSVAGMIQSIIYLMRGVVLAYGRPRWHFCLELARVVFTLAAVLLSVHAGIMAVAWAQALVPLLSLSLLFQAVSRLVHLRLVEYLRTLRPAFIASVVMAFAIFIVKLTTAGHMGPAEVLIIALAAGIGVYLAAFRVVNPSDLLRSVRYVQAMFGSRQSGRTLQMRRSAWRLSRYVDDFEKTRDGTPLRAR
jgi:O-antigen/teichoic acid export membrane protein